VSTPATAQGRETRERILDAAAELIAEHGPHGTSLDDVRATTHTSKSQLYHYFGDKQGLIHAVTDRQCGRVIALHAELLAEVRDWAGLRRWADAIVTITEAQGFRGELARELVFATLLANEFQRPPAPAQAAILANLTDAVSACE